MTSQGKYNEKDDASTQVNLRNATRPKATRPQHPNFAPGSYPTIYI